MAAKPPGNPNPVSKVYQSVIDDVINNVRETFLDDGVDEHVLQELKSTWESKLMQSKAVENPQTHPLAQQGISVYVNTPVMYKAVPKGMQAIPMTAAGQQATLALPANVPLVYQKLPTTASSQPQQYTTFQQPHQYVQQPSTQTVLQSQRPKDQESSSNGQSQPSAIIQVDGASNNIVRNETKQKDVCEPSTSSAPSYKSPRGKTSFKCKLHQVDGGMDSSSSDDDDDEDDEEEDDDEDDEEEDDEAEGKDSSGVVEEPLCSDDDGTDEDPVELFDTDNVVVCQYDKIHRAKSRWKFTLKLGIMNLNGKDMVFQKATGEADW